MLREMFVPDIQKFLTPIRGGEACGLSIRYEPVYQDIRRAREFDDPSLPMGEWERPLKKADWKLVAKLCSELICNRSKDLQLAGWLCEAWTHLYQIEGLNAGIELIEGLIDTHWDSVHPQIEDGDIEPRIAPFAWMNETFPLMLKLNVRLMSLPDRNPQVLYLADWDHVITAEAMRERGESEGGNDKPLVTREELLNRVPGENLLHLVDMRAELLKAIHRWTDLGHKLDYHAGNDAPSLSKVNAMLKNLLRATESLINGRDPTPARTPDAEVASRVHAAPEAMTTPTLASNSTFSGNTKEQPRMNVPATPIVPDGPITSREQAYRMLEAAAEYLQSIEPHSPTPYLVRRAVSWGGMSLADLMKELLNEEGDLRGYFKMLGIQME